MKICSVYKVKTEAKYFSLLTTNYGVKKARTKKTENWGFFHFKQKKPLFGLGALLQANREEGCVNNEK